MWQIKIGLVGLGVQLSKMGIPADLSTTRGFMWLRPLRTGYFLTQQFEGTTGSFSVVTDYIQIPEQQVKYLDRRAISVELGTSFIGNASANVKLGLYSRSNGQKDWDGDYVVRCWGSAMGTVKMHRRIIKHDWVWKNRKRIMAELTSMSPFCKYPCPSHRYVRE